MQLIKYKKLFLDEAQNKLKDFEDAVMELEKEKLDKVVIAKIQNLLHSLKSYAATMSYTNFANALHQTEDFFISVKQGSVELTSLNIDSVFMLINSFRTNLDQIGKNSSEIDLGPATAFMLRDGDVIDPKKKPDKRITQIGSKPATEYEPLSSFVEVSAQGLDQSLDIINRLISQNQQMQRSLQRGDSGNALVLVHSQSTKMSDLRRLVVDLKMMPVKQYFAFLARMVRDLSREGKKFITFQFDDNNLRFDAQILESLREVCIHLIKNAVDHGFAENEKGKVTLSFGFRAHKIHIIISDNGSGFNWQALEKRAIAAGKAKKAQLAKLSPEKRHNYLFGLGVSTVKKASLTSGRGVGLSSVHEIVAKLQGTIVLTSRNGTKDHGAAIEIIIPLAPTMFRAITWRWGSYNLALPLFIVEKIIQLPDKQQGALGKRYRFGKRSLPVIDLMDLFGTAVGSSTSMEPDAVAVVTSEGKQVAVALPVGTQEQELIIQSLACLSENRLVSGVAVSESSMPITILNHRAFFE